MGESTALVDVELERAVLSCVMAYPETFEQVADVLGAVDAPFTLGSHKVTWNAMQRLARKGVAIEDISVMAELTPQERDELPPGFVPKLSTAAPVRMQAQQVAERALAVAHRRVLADACRDSWHMLAQGEDVETAAGLLTQVMNPPAAARGENLGLELAAFVERRLQAPEVYRPGHSVLDPVASFEPGMHTVLGGLSGHGKTVTASVIVAGLLHSHPELMVDWWSCEVPRPLMAARLASCWSTNFNNKPLREAMMRSPESASEKDWAAATEAFGQLAEWDKQSRLSVYDGAIRLEEVQYRTAAKRSRYPDRPYVVVIDYLQRMAVRGTSSSVERVEEASKGMADLAVRHNAMTLALTQLTTEVAKSDPIPMPRTSHARWSKDIENDAANFLIWHRPWKHSDKDSDVGILQQAKSRYGSLGHVVCSGEPVNNKIKECRWNPDVPGLTTGEL